MNNNEQRIEHIEVIGIVQGVGFRPFVHNLAERHSLGGYLLNSPNGVVIEIEGEKDALEDFIYDLNHNAPPLSRIVEINRTVIEKNHRHNNTHGIYDGFEIRDSVHEGRPATFISPDVCICGDCLKELFDPGDRRYLYPFINCTNYGPRFTIIRDLPYDRPFTTMSSFNMCPDCMAEYDNHLNRRFHAQPNACPVCGPRMELLDRDGNPMPGDSVATSINLLKDGKIVAVKGLGGFHLAVDACNNEAVLRLRQLKHRKEKSLAVMVGTSLIAGGLVQLDYVEEQILTGRERPNLLALRKDRTNIADVVAPGNAYLGIMLPYTPLHYIIFFHPAAGGNYTSSKPEIVDELTALWDAWAKPSFVTPCEEVKKGQAEFMKHFNNRRRP